MEAGAQSGVDINRRTRGAALVDLNLDGCLDIVTVNREQPAALFQNTSCATQGNAVMVELRQAGPNVDAVGARVAVDRTGDDEIYFTAVGGGHAGGALGPVHIGMGEATDVTVAITWPDGRITGPHVLRAGFCYRATRTAAGTVELSVLRRLAG